MYPRVLVFVLRGGAQRGTPWKLISRLSSYQEPLVQCLVGRMEFLKQLRLWPHVEVEMAMGEKYYLGHLKIFWKHMDLSFPNYPFIPIKHIPKE